VRRGATLLSAAAVALLAVALVGEIFGGEPSGPVSSSYATNAHGVAAWASLLTRNGRKVTQLRASLQKAELSPADTAVVLDPESLIHSEGSRLAAFTEAGGRLVIGGREPQSTLPALLVDLPTWMSSGAERLRPAADAGAAVSGVAEVLTAGEGAWTQSAGYVSPLQSYGNGALLLERRFGAGTIALLADASPLQNRLLASADNAQFALDLSGPARRPVVFVESVHGFGEARGLAAIPSRWWVALAGLLGAGLLWVLARGRRLGAPEPASEMLQPARADYANAIALLLRRARAPQDVQQALIRLRDEQ
jgi:hypothetical protein